LPTHPITNFSAKLFGHGRFPMQICALSSQEVA
jgi:hypothetical protein